MSWIKSVGKFGKWIVLVGVVGLLGLALVGVLLGRNVSLAFNHLGTLNITAAGPPEATMGASGPREHSPSPERPEPNTARKRSSVRPGRR